MKKRLLLTSAVLGAAVLSGIFLATGASASTGGLKSRLAEKLGIEESRVKGVMDEIKSENQDKMQAKQEENLQEAVDDGVITSKQKDALIAKQKEHREKMEQLRDEMDGWYEEQGIDKDALREYRVGKGMGKGSGGGMHGMM